MQSSEENSPIKTLVFIGVGIVLLGLTVFGVVFAKYRADTYDNKSNEQQVVQQDTASPELSTPVAQQPGESHSAGSVAGSETTPSTTVQMPAAGATDSFMIATGLAISAFFATKIVMQRRIV